jgi:hypothetical protein
MQYPRAYKEVRQGEVDGYKQLVNTFVKSAKLTGV